MHDHTFLPLVELVEQVRPGFKKNDSLYFLLYVELNKGILLAILVYLNFYMIYIYKKKKFIKKINIYINFK